MSEINGETTETMLFSFFERRESFTVSDIMWQVLPNVRPVIMGEIAETVLFSFTMAHGERRRASNDDRSAREGA